MKMRDEMADINDELAGKNPSTNSVRGAPSERLRVGPSVDSARVLRFSMAMVDHDQRSLESLENVVKTMLPEATLLWSTTEGLKACEIASGNIVPDVILIDMSMETMSGIVICRRIRRLNRITKIIAMTSFSVARFRDDVAEAGAQGIVNKNSVSDVITGIRTIVQGDTYGGQGFESAQLSHFRIRSGAMHTIDIISNRELQVMDLLAAGVSDNAIAHHLGIKPATVRKHIQSAMYKLRATNRIQAVLKWTGQYGQYGQYGHNN